MFEKTTSDLAEEMDDLIGHEAACNRLIGLVKTDEELEMSSYYEEVCLATLERLSDIIARRVQTIDRDLEDRQNQALDRFRRRQIR